MSGQILELHKLCECALISVPTWFVEDIFFLEAVLSQEVPRDELREMKAMRESDFPLSQMMELEEWEAKCFIQHIHESPIRLCVQHNIDRTNCVTKEVIESKTRICILSRARDDCKVLLATGLQTLSA